MVASGGGGHVPLLPPLGSGTDNKNKKSVKFQGDMLNFNDFIQVFVFTTNHHLNDKFTTFRTLNHSFMYIFFLRAYAFKYTGKVLAISSVALPA